MRETTWQQMDRAHVWHPYTTFSALEKGPLPVIVRGRGIHLYDADGRRYVDAISSWWCCALGHGRPEILAAMRRQAARLQHSILGNLSHPAAAALAARLAALMPDPRRHVLFASDGASAVEQALKIAVQVHHNRGQPKRQAFAAIRAAYHGDTLGAMSVGYLDKFHRPFRRLLAPAVALPFPTDDDFAPARAILDRNAARLAAVIVEPLCLGAAGMRMYGQAWLRSLGAWCRHRRVPLIVDEIAMGFGRTGRMFAFEHAGIDPDIVCVGKAMSAGTLPISATIVKDRLYRTFGADADEQTLQHGHTFCGNPIAAAAALASLDLVEKLDLIAETRRKAELLWQELAPAALLPQVREVRVLGLIGAVELQPEQAKRGAETRPQRVRRILFERGVLMRPLGNVVYLMPPLVISDRDLKKLARDYLAAIRGAG